MTKDISPQVEEQIVMKQSENLDFPALDAQLTGNLGLYFVCYQLSLRGWNVMPTARNARGVDIIAYNRDATKLLGIQVKALSKRNPVPLGMSLDKVMGNFWIVVNKVATPNPCVYILTPEEVRRLAHKSKPDAKGLHSHWLQPTEYELPAFTNAWHRIGHG